MTIFKRIALLSLGLFSLLTYITFSGLIDSPGFDYTEEYTLYQDVGKLASIKDVEDYLCAKDIQYKIKESKLVLPDYDDIEYFILSDNHSGYIKHSNLHRNLSRLDERDLDIVTIKKELINNETQEIIYLEDNGLTYTKIANNYYIEPTWIYTVIIIVSFFSYIILLPSMFIILMDDFFEWLKKKKESKKLAVKSASTSNDDNTKS